MFGASILRKLRLAKANRRLKSAELDGFLSEYEKVLEHERELAKSKGEPYLESCDFPFVWSGGAPAPHLIASEGRVFLICYLEEADPDWDGSDIRIVDPGSNEIEHLCLITFDGCIATKFGHPNDEVQSGHPFYGKGLLGGTAQTVRNSPWITEVANINSVHPNDDPLHWDQYEHYIFWFHDSTFECLAKSYEAEAVKDSVAGLLNTVQQRLLRQ